MVIKRDKKFGSVKPDDALFDGTAAFSFCTGTFWHDNHGWKWDSLLTCCCCVYMNTTLLEPSAAKLHRFKLYRSHHFLLLINGLSVIYL